MKRIQTVHCPNCGSHGEKIHFPKQNLTQISCPSCDYFIVHCPDSGKVVEAYAPGLKIGFLQKSSQK
jgi:predicted RNA-binding Zn-ribbon protein involved in translation (DUF1610 family)